MTTEQLLPTFMKVVRLKNVLPIFLTILYENMRNDDIIIMDNIKSHHAKSVIIFMTENE